MYAASRTEVAAENSPLTAMDEGFWLRGEVGLGEFSRWEEVGESR